MQKLLLLFVLLFSINLFPQTYSYDIYFENYYFLAGDAFYFDVILRSEYGFTLDAYQGIIEFNKELDPTGLYYVTGSSDLVNEPGFLQLTEDQIRFASGVGTDVIDRDEIRIGTFILARDGNFPEPWIFDFDWVIGGGLGTIILADGFQDITQYGVFSDLYYEVIGDGFSNFSNYPNPFNPATTVIFH